MNDTSTPPPQDRPLEIGAHSFASRLIVGTGKYRDEPSMLESIEASGAQMVTVAVRRADLGGGRTILDALAPLNITFLPNTAGCYTCQDAVRTARLGRELAGTPLVKLEVLGDENTLLPDPIGTLEATQILVEEGFTVLVYTTDDPIMARHLEEAGASCVMPAGSPIGSGQGILNPNNIRIILETLSVPVVVDAGVGTASDVAIAMELGVEGVLLNTAIAGARHPAQMAHAMRLATQAGRHAFLSGRIPRKLYAKASSPTDGLITSGSTNES
ncbi:MAG: thiazole synthase [Planctomycetota bacterium]|nr:thiazole synthase [Planctomycetota bacterium]